MWPISVNLRDEEFGTDTTFGLGAMADSVFEYLPKMTALLGGLVPSYEKMYTRAMDTAMKYNLCKLALLLFAVLLGGGRGNPYLSIYLAPVPEANFS